MLKTIPYITCLILTGFTAINVTPVMAGGCNNQMNKKAEIKCAQDDTECKAKKVEKFELIKTVRS